MKLTRYDGHVPLFSQDMEGRERTLFGSTVQDDDINNQFTPEFLRGWGSVGSTEFPTLQDFNALAYTHNKLLSYLYQAGVPSYTQNEEYYIGSIVQYNKDIYICLRDKPTVLPTDTNAWKRLQESLTFVGDGPEVMKKGAFGIGKLRSEHFTFPTETPNDERINSLMLKENGIYRMIGSVGASQHPTILTMHSSDTGTEISALFAVDQFRNRASLAFKAGVNKPIIQADIYTTINTRTDKHKVLHVGTTTPINTLNVSDMSQEVINNELLTVTSGAVYRALQPKADSTYVNTELNKKANLTYVNSELLKKADKTYVDTELNKKANLTYVNTELDKKITGGNVVHTTGQSTIDVMSQKGVSDTINNLNIDYALVDFGIIDKKSRYVKQNPFGNNTPVITVTEVEIAEGVWATQNVGWHSVHADNTATSGCNGGFVLNEGLVVVTGAQAVVINSGSYHYGALVTPTTSLVTAKCRMHVWRLKK